MHKIKYYNLEVVEIFFNEETGEYDFQKELKELEFSCNDAELEKYLKQIQDAYGRYGKVTHEHIEDEPTREELTIKTINNLTIDNKKKDILIASLAEQINNLNIKLTQLGGIENV